MSKTDPVTGAVRRAIPPEDPVSRREYLTCSAVLMGADIWTAIEAVASVGLSHPEWDMDEMREWADWEQG